MKGIELETSLIQQYRSFLVFIWSDLRSLHLIFSPSNQKQAFVGREWLQADPLPLHPEAAVELAHRVNRDESFQDWGHGVL